MYKTLPKTEVWGLFPGYSVARLVRSTRPQVTEKPHPGSPGPQVYQAVPAREGEAQAGHDSAVEMESLSPRSETWQAM